MSAGRDIFSSRPSFDDAKSNCDDDGRVGYARPPMSTRFRKGVSGNPRGRPKGARNFASIVAATLGERLVINENGKRKRITKLEAAVKQLVNRAAGGDARSIQLLIGLLQTIEARPSQLEPHESTEADSNVLRELKRRLAESKT
jgi:hypothetical protein